MSEKSDHMEHTPSSTEDDTLSLATVTEKFSLSPTVIGIELFVSDDKFSFLPGQWIDTHIPNVPVIGGFSMTSTIDHYTKTRKIGLAIKYSEHPPTYWFHNKASLLKLI
ncbi:DgyrCDS5947 [Dimorphilus gyrociliatus]|uniref:DgyrCDS5947 n=1 Tax=Dimorphilus gyrociliatus TaxID=2664684 RepID=A0A7I8VLJ7_9ANNE|nr:DgyrCDS5947 [Dimorphilus gyrociliatus]